MDTYVKLILFIKPLYKIYVFNFSMILYTLIIDK
ncbi:hypothetical protein QE357_001168 [Siphonobacter sp. BAB-5404]|nr:hypothetical protein [Siphonobacter sp. SORGH_AS_1065]MDR6194116.1 hypothetical protein [Siphonobacter sp. SORGH_AS_0500]